MPQDRTVEDGGQDDAPTIEVRGFIAKNGNGNLAFFATTRSTGVPLTSGPRALRDAVYAADARRVLLADLAALDPSPRP